MAPLAGAGDAGRRGATRGEDALSAAQHRAVLALLEHPTVAEAAKGAGVHRATLHRWLKEPGFRDAYREARRESLRLATARLQQISGEAVEALREIVGDRSQQGASRVGAARCILDYAARMTELEDFGERLARLEERA